MTSTSNAPRATTVDDAEVARFSAIADEWWDTRGKFAPLHRLNPVRIEYIRDQIIRHFARQKEGAGQSATPLNNLSLVDIGCGGGLMSEPMARLGALVTGIDASETNIRVAALHAEQSGLTIDYRATTAEALACFNYPHGNQDSSPSREEIPPPLRGRLGGGAGSGTQTENNLHPPSPQPSPARGEGAAPPPHQYDVVMALEIIEHVADVGLFYDALAALVKPGGLLILSTLNRTPKSYALGIIGAEYVLRWLPRGTHSWKKFIRPPEMAMALAARQFVVADTTGITFSPTQWKFSINPKDLDVNYLMVARRR